MPVFWGEGKRKEMELSHSRPPHKGKKKTHQKREKKKEILLSLHLSLSVLWLLDTRGRRKERGGEKKEGWLHTLVHRKGKGEERKAVDSLRST